MLHIVPSRRPTAAQILRHPWIVQQMHLNSTQPIEIPPNSNNASLCDSTTAALKGAVNATFRAISSPQAANGKFLILFMNFTLYLFLCLLSFHFSWSSRYVCFSETTC